MTKKEVGAIFGRFDSDGDGTVNGKEFMASILQIWSGNALEKVRARREEEEGRRSKKREKEKEMEDKVIAELTSVKLSDRFDEDDFNSGLDKLESAAVLF